MSYMTVMVDEEILALLRKVMVKRLSGGHDGKNSSKSAIVREVLKRGLARMLTEDADEVHNQGC